jgi:hypothetical protein
VGNPRDNTGVHVETEKMLHDLVEEVVDTVAAFDGRLTYTPMSADGTCVLTFSTRNDQVHLWIHARVHEENRVEISFQCSEDNATTEQRNVAFSGLFDQTAIRHHLGTGLADWYGRAVRQQRSHDAK